MTKHWCLGNRLAMYTGRARESIYKSTMMNRLNVHLMSEVSAPALFPSPCIGDRKIDMGRIRWVKVDRFNNVAQLR